MTRDELRELISAPAIRDRYEPDHVRHYAGLQLDALSAAGYAVVPLEATEKMLRNAAIFAPVGVRNGINAAIAKGNILEDGK